MTVSQIKSILSDVYGISSSTDKWIRLPQVSIIFLTQDANIYIGDSEAFYFNTKDETLNISKGHLSDEILKTKLSDYTKSSIIPFSRIGGFISSSVMVGAGSYNKRRF